MRQYGRTKTILRHHYVVPKTYAFHIDDTFQDFLLLVILEDLRGLFVEAP